MGIISKIVKNISKAQKKLYSASKAQTKNTYKTASASKSYTPTTSSLSIHDNSYYQDDKNMSASEALDYLNSSELFHTNKYEEVTGNRNQILEGLNCVANGGRYKIDMDTDGDGELENVSIAEAVAASFDSELDLYIQEQLTKILGKYGHKIKTGFLCDEAVAELAEMGIQVNKINNRVYTFSLVDENGNVLEDENGNKGSIIFSDCLIPDGYAQGAEFNLSSLLDVMGYDCISKADFIGREDEYYEVISQVESNLNNGLYSAGEQKVEDIYGEVQTSWSPSSHGASSATSGELSNETQEAMEKELQEMEEDKQKEIQKVYEEKLKKEKEQYMEEHDGLEASGEALNSLTNQVRLEMVSRYGTDALHYLK